MKYDFESPCEETLHSTICLDSTYSLSLSVSVCLSLSVCLPLSLDPISSFSLLTKGRKKRKKKKPGEKAYSARKNKNPKATTPKLLAELSNSFLAGKVGLLYTGKAKASSTQSSQGV